MSLYSINMLGKVIKINVYICTVAVVGTIFSEGKHTIIINLDSSLKNNSYG